MIISALAVAWCSSDEWIASAEKTLFMFHSKNYTTDWADKENYVLLWKKHTGLSIKVYIYLI